MLKRIHERIGDFWWYSLMIFCAARAADFLNMFVGLWLVPKYVSPQELGAVQPLAGFANFLVIPAGVFAATFRQEISNLAMRGEFGRMKSLMRGVFIATAVFFLLALVCGRFLLPAFLERIRVADGSLGFVILAASFFGTLSAVYANPLQALKKFRATSLINILGAPVRLVVMLVAMPFRALTGYFVGQASTPAFTVIASVVALRKELSVPAQPYWTRDVIGRFGRLLLIFAIGSLSGGFCSLVETTVIRQRLPELDSAAFYMVTRFSDIASFMSGTLCFTIFPFAAELAARGRGTNSLVLKSSAAVLLVNGVLAVFFWAFGADMLAVLPHGDKYAAYAWAIPCMIAVTTINSCSSFYTTAEISANRFGFMWFTVAISLVSGCGLLFVTGQGYFLHYLPVSVADFLREHNILTLRAVLLWMLAFALIRLACCFVYAVVAGRRSRRPGVVV